jgi:hypothetical protein
MVIGPTPRNAIRFIAPGSYRAKDKGAKLIVADPRHIQLAGSRTWN